MNDRDIKKKNTIVQKREMCGW